MLIGAFRILSLEERNDEIDFETEEYILQLETPSLN